MVAEHELPEGKTGASGWYSDVHRIARPPTSSAHAQFARTYKIVDILPSTDIRPGRCGRCFLQRWHDRCASAMTGAPMTSQLRYVILAVLLAQVSSVIDVDDRRTDRLPPFSEINGQSHHWQNNFVHSFGFSAKKWTVWLLKFTSCTRLNSPGLSYSIWYVGLLTLISDLSGAHIGNNMFEDGI